MTFENFKKRVSALANAAGLSVQFKHDDDKGRHEAWLSDGSMITGNSSQIKLTLRRKNGFQAMFE